MPELPFTNTPNHMSARKRLLYVTRLRKTLDVLMTDEERNYYGIIFEGLADFQGDLLIDIEREMEAINPDNLPD